jgi:hypothetical protein
MSIWDRAAAALNAGLDAVHTEATNVVRPVGGSAYVASSAPPQILHAAMPGVIDEDAKVFGLDGDAGGQRDFRGQMQAGAIIVSYDRRLFADIGDWPRKDDLIQAIEREGAPVFEVLTATPDEGHRLNCQVVRRKSP